MKNRNLGFYSRGNGVGVADSLHYKYGDFEMVAHIGRNREIKYYVELSIDDKKMIEDYANSADPTISTTQSAKVFEVRSND